MLGPFPCRKRLQVPSTLTIILNVRVDTVSRHEIWMLVHKDLNRWAGPSIVFMNTSEMNFDFFLSTMEFSKLSWCRLFKDLIGTWQGEGQQTGQGFREQG